jgi:hypothetical protein
MFLPRRKLTPKKHASDTVIEERYSSEGVALRLRSLNDAERQLIRRNVQVLVEFMLVGPKIDSLVHYNLPAATYGVRPGLERLHEQRHTIGRREGVILG